MLEKNCWEIMDYSREPGGSNSKELGVCPAASNSHFDGTKWWEILLACCGHAM